MTLRAVIKKKPVFPNEDNVLKILYLAIQRISQKWTIPINKWNEAINRLIIEFRTERMKL